ncbi:unnamed protein product [Prorocentrum cordatum]|uniref:Uncharacterized protein n=1 Tax=Prorocentrum cordatum TaxID=2364126 RepID=A0ABN9Y199_9DINO|nr:unnamed protein product [Polarella glacialis]
MRVRCLRGRGDAHERGALLMSVLSVLSRSRCRGARPWTCDPTGATRAGHPLAKPPRSVMLEESSPRGRGYGCVPRPQVACGETRTRCLLTELTKGAISPFRGREVGGSLYEVLLRKHPHGLSRLDNRAELWRRRFLYDFIASWYRGCRFFSVATISGQQFFVRLLLYRVRFAKLSAPARFPTRRRQSARVIPMLETDRRCHPDSDQKSDLRRKVDLF